MTVIETTPAPETKMATGAEITEAFDEFMHAFESFKDANDERLAQIETRFSTDVITEEKMARINKAVDEQKRHLDGLILKSRRPSLANSVSHSPAQTEHKSGFDTYVRQGNEAGLRELEGKAMSVGSDPDGGYLVPEELSSEIGQRLSALSPIRSISSVRQVSASVFTSRSQAQDQLLVGWAKPKRVRKRPHRVWLNCNSPPWNCTQCQPPLRLCLKTQR